MEECGRQGVVHITGGGFPENIPRVVPKGKDLGFRIRRSAWDIPPLFRWLQEARAAPCPAACCRCRLSPPCRSSLGDAGWWAQPCVWPREPTDNRLAVCRLAMWRRPRCSGRSTWAWACWS